jgi:hypothetical protein
MLIVCECQVVQSYQNKRTKEFRRDSLRLALLKNPTSKILIEAVDALPEAQRRDKNKPSMRFYRLMRDLN